MFQTANFECFGVDRSWDMERTEYGNLPRLSTHFMEADWIKRMSKELGRVFLSDLTSLKSVWATVDLRLAEVSDIVTLDGVRMSFSDSVIVHFRQSGNAHGMCCYVGTGERDLTELLLCGVVVGLEAFLMRKGIAV